VCVGPEDIELHAYWVCMAAAADQQSMCVQCLLLLLQSCESQLLLLLLLSVCVCVCLSHRRNDTSHAAAALVSVDVDSSCDERRDKIHRQTDRYSSCSSLQICYTPLPSSRGRMYVPTMAEKGN